MAAESKLSWPESSEQAPNRLVLLDAGSIYYPAFHVMQDLATPDGFPTGAIFGFTRTLLKVVGQYPSAYAAVAFDARGPTVRHEKYEAYKAHRPSMDDALAVQIPRIKEIIEAFRIPIFEAPGYEADDLIATFAQAAADEGADVLIVSGDKDLMQLVNERVTVLKPSRKPGEDFQWLDAEGVTDYLGVAPSKIPDYLALVGDTSDNVPGVPGVGEKTAQTILQQFEALHDVLAHADEIGNSRARKALQANRDQAELSYDLVQLETVPLETEGLEACAVGEPDWPRVRDLFAELAFNSLLDDLGLTDDASQTDGPDLDVNVVTTEQALDDLCAQLGAVDEVSLDLETTSENDMAAEIVGIALSTASGSGTYIPIAHDDPDGPDQLPLSTVLDRLRPDLQDGHLTVIGQNLKYDAKILRRNGLALGRIGFDSMLAAYLLDPMGRKDLGELAERYVGQSIQSFKDLGVERMTELPIADAAAYGAADAEAVVRLKEAMVPELEGKGLTRLFHEVEMPLIPVLVEMELNGIRVDRDALAELEKELTVYLDGLKDELVKLAGEAFNPNSPKQVARILFEVLELPVVKRTKTGPSTDAQVLRELAAKHPLPEKLLTYRELDKLLGTYIRALPGHIHPASGRVHTSFNQSVTTTGRLSSSHPNLQNIPTRSAVGGQIREAFVAPEGRRLIGADYSQIELRVLAHIAEDPGLIDAFARNEDIHARTAANILHVDLDEVTEQQRDLAKRVNFGIAYGMSAFGLAQWAKIPHQEAQDFIDSYFKNFPNVKRYMDEIVKQADEQGYVASIMGRRRPFTSLNQREQREAINMPIQGTAADIMKLAMLRVHERVEAGEIEADMLLQIHDELILEADEADAEEVARLVETTMADVVELNVPLEVDAKIGRNWGEF